MKQKYFFTGLFLLTTVCIHAQDALNVAGATQQSPNTAAAARSADTRVDYFTGTPAISVPLFSYSDKNGLSLGISANFTGGGGVRNGETPSVIGMGWNLSTGGIISRTVRGIPDDMPTYGYMYAAAIPADFRADANKYYYDSLDAQQDVFQFSVNGRSGKFVIGKNKEVAVMPLSKIKIQFTAQANQVITSFKITTEDGVKYVFDKREFSSNTIKDHDNDYYRSQFSGHNHTSAWYLSQVISPFYTDTIKFTYITRAALKTDFAYPQVVFVKNSTNTVTATYDASGTNTSDIIKLSKITFPDKRQVDFIYSYKYKYDGEDPALSKIKISDTIFRYGFAFDYQTTYTGKIVTYAQYELDEPSLDSSSTNYKTALLLKSITPYTQKQADKAYEFTYNTPYMSKDDIKYGDSMQNAYDHWGFFNGKNNQAKTIPTTFPYFPLGAMRSPNIYATQNSLAFVKLPSGGLTKYEYEPNEKKRDQVSTTQVQVTGNTASYQNNVTFSQLYNEQHQLVFILDKSVSRVGAAPLSGTCNLTVSIKNTAGTTTYTSGTFSLYDLYYQGIKTFTFNVPNGVYRLETALSGGGTITAASFPFAISWENRTTSSVNTYAGGIRIKKITRSNPGDVSGGKSITEEFKYVLEDGQSSGFLGNVPRYDYPFDQTITSTGVTTAMTALSSDPANAINFAEGNTVGYSRVEVYQGTAIKNLGKTIYEFTDLKDVNANYYSSIFPYTPDDLKVWGLGMPKRILVYDSSGSLLKKTTNNFSFPIIGYVNNNFKNINIGKIKITYAQDPSTNPTTTRVNTYMARERYFITGIARLDVTTDTTYNTDGSILTSYIDYDYDINYNVSKTITSYDRNRNLQLETRFYYPYNYILAGAIGKLRDSSINTLISSEKWVTGDVNPRVLAINITDYKELPEKYIVPNATYALESNKPINHATIGAFNGAALVRNSVFIKEQAAYLLYDAKGNLLQTKNTPHNQNSCVIMDYNNQFIVAKASLTVNNNMAYTSFESDSKGNWAIPSTTRDKTAAITGKNAYQLSNGDITKSALDPATTYVFTAWGKFGSGSMYVNGAATTNISSHRGWGLYTIKLSGISSVTISGTALIDEIRLHPDYCNMETYTYEPNVGVTSVCDYNNNIIYNEYDNLNRIAVVRDVDRNVIKKMAYSDNITAIDNAPQWVGTGTQCIPNKAEYDSVYTDMNPYSDTYYGTQEVYKGLDCDCPSPDSRLYKEINGVCQKAFKVYTDGWQRRDSEGNWYWWCIFHWQWSDGSRLPDEQENNGSVPCTVQS